MAPHLSPDELDLIHRWQNRGKTPAVTHDLLTQRRARRNVAAPRLSRLRQALRGLTYKRSRKETRGRKKTYNKRWVLKMNAKRKSLIKKAHGQREVRWEDVRKGARAPKGHRSTLVRSFRREGILVEAPPPRLKPSRTAQQAKQRVEYCKET